MSASLTFEDYVDALYSAAERLQAELVDVPDDRAVPTCPAWSVRELVAHTGMVHRWATDIVRGSLDPRDTEAATEQYENDGMQVDDPGAWLLAGAGDLARALEDAPEDLERFFLRDAAPAKVAWARRQCHETTIHAVDALSARINGFPLAAMTDIDASVAADGVDELLRGFATRRHEELRTRTGSTVTAVLRATDTARAWTLRLSGEPAVCDEGITEQDPDASISGTAVQLYLGLWNRGDEVVQEGADVLGFWRDHMRVEWS